jgi:hypothetical protein
MTLNHSTTFLTLLATVLLVAASVTSSDARPHGNRLSPTRSEILYYYSDSDTRRDRDGSCHSRSTGLPDQYSCSAGGA